MGDGGGDPLTEVVSTTTGIPLVPSADGRQQQQGAERQQESLSHGGTDPKYIADFEVFERLSHDDIYNAVQQMQPGVMQQFGDKWVEMFVEISGAVTGLMLQTARAASSLDGAFASAGEAAGRRFVTEAGDVYTVLSVVGHRVKAAAYGAEAVKIAVPAPVTAADGAVTGGSSVPPNLAELAVPDSAAAVEREKEDRRLQAIAAMNMTYKPTYGPAGESVPTFVAPTQPGGGTVDPGSGGGASSNGGGSAGSGGGDGTGAGDPGDTAPAEDTVEPGTTTDDESSGAGTGDSPGADDSQGDNTDPAGTDLDGTTPAAATAAAGSPGIGSPGIGSPGAGSPGAGSPGAGLPGGSGPGSGAPAPGAAVLGRVPAGSPQNPMAAGASGSAGSASSARGGPGMMGAPGARGGGKDDEDEHQTPDYLRGVHPELLGDEQATVPQAIGADAPATRLPDQEPGAS
ncbi:hypothetical protein ACFO5K_17305 [Nocardia halotolerans]|uniref:PPE family protein n=1 Tax=Nocardia halotolerans TaxID=1755878 RepID=A0ABV8VK05_9NOCA